MDNFFVEIRQMFVKKHLVTLHLTSISHNYLGTKKAAKIFSPFFMSEDLEDLRDEDEEPNADDAEETRLEGVVALVAVLKQGNISVN